MLLKHLHASSALVEHVSTNFPVPKGLCRQSVNFTVQPLGRHNANEIRGFASGVLPTVLALYQTYNTL